MNVDDAAGVCFLIPTYSLHKLPNINKTGKIFTYTRMLAAGATQAAPAQARIFQMFYFLFFFGLLSQFRLGFTCHLALSGSDMQYIESDSDSLPEEDE